VLSGWVHARQKVNLTLGVLLGYSGQLLRFRGTRHPPLSNEVAMTAAKPRNTKPPSTRRKAAVADTDSKDGEAAPAFTQDELAQVWGLATFRMPALHH